MEFDPFFVRRAISFAGNEEIVESTAKFNVQVLTYNCLFFTLKTLKNSLIKTEKYVKYTKMYGSETGLFAFQESQEVEEVKIFEFLNWAENTYPTSAKIMVKMIEHVHDWRKTRNTDGPVLVVSV